MIKMITITIKRFNNDNDDGNNDNNNDINDNDD